LFGGKKIHLAVYTPVENMRQYDCLPINFSLPQSVAAAFGSLKPTPPDFVNSQKLTTSFAKTLTFFGKIITLYIDHLCNRPTMEKGKSNKKGEMVPGTLDMLILKTLERNREPMHGYGIALYLRRTTNDVLQVEEGSLYPALQRLTINGWVDSEWAMSEKNHRARFYRLTPAGRKQLRQEVADFDRMLEAILLAPQPAGGGA
jgi:transcriptional regulator